MNTYYKRYINKNYICFDSEDNESSCLPDFRVKMLLHNKIEGFLPMTIENKDSKSIYMFEISGYQTLSSLYEVKRINSNSYTLIINSMKAVLENLDKYMLNINNLILNPDCIFIRPETGMVYFAYCPYNTDSFDTSFKNLLCFLLNKVDHNDEKCVLSIYAIHQASQSEGMSYIDILDSAPLTTKNENIPKKVEPIPVRECFTKKSVDCKSLFPHIKLPLILCFLLIFICFIQYKINLLNGPFFLSLILLNIIVILYYIYKAYKNRSEFYYAPSSNFADKKQLSSNQENESSYLDNAKMKTVLLYDKKQSNKYRLIYSGNENFSDIDINEFPKTIGKQPDKADILINSPLVSRIHAKLIAEDNNIYITDMNSSNGTYINEIAITPYTKVLIKSGDTISFAKLSYVFMAC